jgi:glycerophosphoryl diester phosphodiesterase
MKWNIYQLTSSELISFDCGSLPHPRFPDQKKLQVKKPLLTDVFEAVKKYCDDKGISEPSYNIELKASEDGDHIFHPEPGVFCEIVYTEIINQIPLDRLTIQSFDFRILRYFHETYPEVKLSVLIENDQSAQSNLEELGFNPTVYSSYYKGLSKEQVDWLHAQGIKVVPWTVNEVPEMNALIQMGVDGIITDYPNLIDQVAS